MKAAQFLLLLALLNPRVILVCAAAKKTRQQREAQEFLEQFRSDRATREVPLYNEFGEPDTSEFDSEYDAAEYYAQFEDDEHDAFVRNKTRAGCSVQFHPYDDGRGLNPSLLVDPLTFVPTANPEVGRMTMWGAEGPSSTNRRERWPATKADNDAEEWRKRALLAWYPVELNQYGEWEGRYMSPEQQWVQVRIGMKQRELAVAATRDDRDFTLRVAITQLGRQLQSGTELELHPSVWRRLRVSGRTTLRELHDHVLGPAFGWKRGYHCYMFSDLSDGAQFGPTRCSAVDWQHVVWRAGCRYGCVIDDSTVELGQVVHRAGDRLVYTYDLGDAWNHMITVESAAHSANFSNVATVPAWRWINATVIDGLMACPPEDSLGYQGMGADNYQKEILDLVGAHTEVISDRGGVPISFKVVANRRLPSRIEAVASQAANYKQGTRGSSFDPVRFSLKVAQRRMDEAAKSEPINPLRYTAGNLGERPLNMDPGFGTHLDRDEL